MLYQIILLSNEGHYLINKLNRHLPIVELLNQLEMTDQEFAVAYLKAVEKKHKAYFDAARLHIMNCVVIKGNTLVSVHIVNGELPFEIRHDIETMFWAS